MDAMVRRPLFAGAPNLRDLAGVPLEGGRLRPGLVFRSDQLSDLDEAEVAGLAGLRLAAVWDLRSGPERAARPDRLPPGVAAEVADVLGEARGAAPAEFFALLEDPARANALLGGGRAEAEFLAAYRGFVDWPGARQGFGRMFRALAAPDAGPALFHCATGKDRTGWAAALLLRLLGASEEAVLADYMASNDWILPKYAGFIDRLAAKGMERDMLVTLFGVRPDFLAAAFDAMRAGYGDLAGYLDRGLGLDPEAQARLRGRLLA